MNSILSRYIGFALVAFIAGAGGGYVTVNNKPTQSQIPSSPSLKIAQSETIPATRATPSQGPGSIAMPAIPAMPTDPSSLPRSRNEECTVVPYHQAVGAITSISGVTADLSLYPSDIPGFVRSISGNGTDTANRIEIRNLFLTRSDVLLAAGSDYLWGEFISFPTIYRSTDQGKTWDTSSVPTDNTQSYKFVNDIAEDANGMLWAVGMPGVMKSVDGGVNWTKVNTSFVPFPGGDYLAAQTYRDFVRNVMVLADNSVVITVPFYSIGFWGYAYTNVYKTTDGGLSWNILFTQKGVDTVSIAEVEDGVLVFTDQGGRVYRFAEGVVTHVWSADPRNITDGPFLKTKNGILYYVLNEEAIIRGVIEVVPTVYRSSDNGITWRKISHLPSGSSILGVGDEFAEGSDGRLYFAVYSSCWGGTVYQSFDEGRKWEIASGNVREFPYFFTQAIEEVNGKLIHSGSSGGVIFATP